jgi:hypothetical protein
VPSNLKICKLWLLIFKNSCPQFGINESTILEIVSGLKGFPKIINSGFVSGFGEFNKQHCIVMEKLGPSLTDVLDQRASRVLSLKTTLQIGI